MHHRKAFSTAAALALAAGALFMPEATFARGGGFAGGARGPVFGFPRARIGVHGAIGRGFVRRSPAHFGFKLNAFRLHRGHQRNDANANANYPYGGDGSYGGYGAPYSANDLTGSVAPGPARFIYNIKV